jgi:hypothetical protein
MNQHETEVGKHTRSAARDAHREQRAERAAKAVLMHVTTSQRRSKSALFAFVLGTVGSARARQQLLNHSCVGGTLIANSFGFS